MRYAEPMPRLMLKAKVAAPPRDFIGAIRAKLAATQRPGLIAEVKKASPSRGVIQADFDPVRVTDRPIRTGAFCRTICSLKPLLFL